MMHGLAIAPLELRRAADGGANLRGRFPYNKPAVLSDGGRTGRPQKEIIAPRAFAYRVEDPGEDIHLLVGHSFDTPLASKATGTLTFRDTSTALLFDATITPEIAATSYGKDILAMIAAGLAVGLSPGFRIPPKRAVPVAERIEEEEHDPANGKHRAIIRTILQALLYELSIVTRPAYDEAQVEMRNWALAKARSETPDAGLHRVLNRWRA
jgi:HK97 family phage prohead protease